MDVRHMIIKLAGLLSIFLALLSCTPDWTDEFEMDYTRPSVNPGERMSELDTRDVMILYSAGFNTLTEFLMDDIEDLKDGWLPGTKRGDDVVLVYSHFPKAIGKYSEPNSPTLVRLYVDEEGKAVSDTLVIYEESVISSSPVQFNEVLSFVKERFPAAGYGLIFSSHATGYLPAGFYQKPNDYIYIGDNVSQMNRTWHGAVASPYVEIPYDPSLPAVKSVGQDQTSYSGSSVSYEMELADFAKAIPMKLDYILFDACLMGGIEVAYELREKVSVIGFSQAEVLAEGLNYTTVTTRLLADGKPDPVGVCKDYFEQYDVKNGVNRSATISAVDCRKLEPLAQLCKKLFEKYRGKISAVPYNRVQGFYRYSHHWFYDLESILVQAGISSEELEELRVALNGCVIYKGHTPHFFQGSQSGFEINTFSGLSMYLPSHGTRELGEFYKTLDWNIATGLVK